MTLGDYPLDPNASWQGEARSATCGSRITLSLRLDGDGRIAQPGMMTSACAVGQAASAIFAAGARGRDRADIQRSADDIALWLAQPDAPLPDWPGFAPLIPTRAYPGRHGAIVLPWKAALDALCKPVPAS